MAAVVQLDENFEITIPASVYEQIGAKIGDLISVSVENGRIVITPFNEASAQQITEEAPEAATSHSTWFGSVQGVYGSVEEIDEFIRAERADWK